MNVRKNAHQTHMESLVLLGKDGLNELRDKFDGLIETLKDSTKHRLNTTTKFDGTPAVVMFSKYPGYRDNSIVLKSFINGSNDNSMNSVEEINAKYGDRPDMADKLRYCLELAKCIPAGEAWQGDCLYTSLKEQEIDGVKYLTFHPNKIVYAVSEDNPSYEQIKNSKFGICMHTIYRGPSKSQSFNVDVTRLQNVPDYIYVISPALDINQGKYDMSTIDSLYGVFMSNANKLESTTGYDELCDNVEFQKYWSMFENSRTSDRQSVTIDADAFYDDLVSYIDDKQKTEYDKKLDTLKTEKGRESAKSKYDTSVEQMHVILNDNKELLHNIVDTFNAAAILKMSLLYGMQTVPQSYKTFYLKKDMSYIPANMEGVSVSDQDGNIVKIVDRSSFSNVNRSSEYLSGFQHESLVEEYGKTAVIAMGRMNPITIGHAKLVDKVIEVAEENGADPFIYLTHTYDSKKNPLPYDSKIKWAQKAFGDVVVKSDAKNMIDAMKELQSKGYTDIIYVGGEDRIGGAEDVTAVINKYNGVPDKSGNVPYSFNSISFVSAGSRSGDDEASNASATKARQFVKDNDLEGFKKIVPFDDKDAEDIFNEVKANLKESLTESSRTYRLYHGSPSCDIDIFACDEDTPRSFFTASKEYADEYTYDLDTGEKNGCLYEVDVTANNPIDIDSPAGNEFKKQFSIKNNVMATDELYKYLKSHNNEYNGKYYDCIISREDMPSSMYSKYGEDSNICFIPLNSEQIRIVNKSMNESLYTARDYEKFRKGRDKHYPKLALEMFFNDGLTDSDGNVYKYDPTSNIDALPISNELKEADTTNERIHIAINYLLNMDYKHFEEAFFNLTGLKWNKTTKTPSRDMSKSVKAESDTSEDYSSVENSDSIKNYFSNKYHKPVSYIKVTGTEVVGSRNSRRLVSIIDLFEKKDLYKSTESGASTSEAISDVIFDVTLTFDDGTSADDKVYVSVKLGDGTALVNLGLKGSDADRFANAVLNSYSNNELDLIKSIFSLQGSDRALIVATKDGEEVRNFYYRFKNPNIENIHNAIVNSYGNNYFYYRRDLKKMVYVGDLIDEIRNSSIENAEITATYSSLHICSTCHGCMYKMSLRRRGSTSLEFEVRNFNRQSMPKFRGVEIDDTYTYKKEA